MDNQNTIKEYIEDVIQSSRFAVLATEGNGQPHASLVAITPSGNIRKLIFATYRNTLKYRNLANNNRVAVLIESAHLNLKGGNESSFLTIIGYAEEINTAENEVACLAHLKRHPEMESFINSSDCVFFLVIAQSYQVVNGVDDIRWITPESLDAI